MNSISNQPWYEKTVYQVLGLIAIIFTGLILALVFMPKDNVKPVTENQITPASTKEEVLEMFEKGVGFMTSKERIVWWNGQEEVFEDEIFFNFDYKTEKQKNAWRKLMKEEGFKRFTQVCSQSYAANGIWSLGYCMKLPLTPTSEVN